MSNIGLSTNTFRVTGKYLDMLIDFIVKTKVSEEINQQKKEQLTEFINKIKDSENTEPQFQLLGSIIDRELRIRRSKREPFFAALLESIENNEIEKVIPKIEFIVDALDSENCDALSKIKGE